MLFHCKDCIAKFSRRNYLIRHEKEVHQGEVIKHYNCSKEQITNTPFCEKNNFVRRLKQCAFGSMIREFRITSKENFIHPDDFLLHAKEIVEDLLNKLKTENGSYKVQTKLCVEFVKTQDDTIKDESYFSDHARNLDNYNFEDISQNIRLKIETFTKRGSAWKFSKPLFLELVVCRM